MQSPFSPTFPITLLVELLFGIGYNELVAWWQKHSLIHVSYQVVIGVAATLTIAGAGMFASEMKFWQAMVYLVAFFGASGLPMISGSNRRSVKEKESHKARPWPTAALQARDGAVMDLSALAEQVANKKVTDAQAVNRLHQVIGTLKSV
jgi:hypothetical protein